MSSLPVSWRWCWPLIWLASAQDLWLDTVRIEAEHSPTERLWAADSVWGWKAPGFHLTQLLAQAEGLYLREYGGQGALKTIAFRGLAPSYTAITFQGFPIRQPQLGIVDLSPYYLGGLSAIRLETGGDIAYQPGASGRIDLILRPQSRKSQLNAILGAYGEAALEGLIERPGWHGQLRTLTVQNNYTYDRPARGRLDNAAYRLLQAAGIWSHGGWTWTTWGFLSTQEVPGPVGRLGPLWPPEHLRQARAIQTAWYETVHQALGLQLIADRLRYQDFQGQISSSQQWVLQGLWRRELLFRNHRLTLQVWGVADYLISDRLGRGYWPFRAYRQGEGALWVRWTGPLGRWVYRLEGRLSGLTGMGLWPGGLVAVSNDHVGACVLRGIRFPSLYERFWIGYGNPDLAPERFFQVQGWGRFRRGCWRAYMGLTAALVQDRIVAVPLSPVRWQTLSLGHSRNLSLEARLTYQAKSWEGGLVYTYTLAQDFSLTSGSQLPYVPPYLAAVWLTWTRGAWALSLQLQYVSWRYTSLAGGYLNFLPPYVVPNLTLGYRKPPHQLAVLLYSWGPHTYEVIKGYPMPTRAWRLEWRIGW